MFCLVHHQYTLHFRPVGVDQGDVRLVHHGVNCVYQLNSSTFLYRITVTYVVFINGRIFVRCLGRSKITTFDVTYCFFPVVFVMCGTVTRSTRPVVDCGCNLGRDRHIRHACLLTLGATVNYNMYFTLIAVFYDPRVINVFVSHDCPTCTVTMGKLPLCTANFIFFTIGVMSVNCFRDIRHTGCTAIVALLHNFVLLATYFFKLPLLLKSQKV